MFLNHGVRKKILSQLNREDIFKQKGIELKLIETDE